jgi:hypothetical protein
MAQIRGVDSKTSSPWDSWSYSEFVLNALQDKEGGPL